MKTQHRYYIGLAANGYRALLCSCGMTPDVTQGGRFIALVGPFRTKRGAVYMRIHGANNPHCVTVAQAEKLARTVKEESK